MMSMDYSTSTNNNNNNNDNNNNNNDVINDERAFSDDCETIWFGTIP